MSEQLKEGYKKTEVGIIPNDWTPKTYGELFHFLTTSSFSRDQLSQEGDVRCVHYGDIHTKYHQFIDFQNGFNSFIDLENGKKYPFIKDGDIIMADASEDYSGIGKSVEVKNLGDKLAISGLHTFLLRDKNGDFVDGFKAYIHSMTPVKKSMDRLATGLKVYGVSKANLKTVLVPVPPKPEQKAIAAALSDVDTLIANLDKLIAKKKAIKQGAMQRLLKSPAQGGQRLPGFEGEWEQKLIGDFARVVAGGTPSTLIQEYWNGDIPWMNSGELNLKFVCDVENRISESGLKFSSTQLVPANCVLIGLAGQGKTRGTAAINLIPLCTNQSIAAIIPNDSYVSLFLYYFMDLQYHELRKLSTGDGGRGGLNLTIIRNVLVPFPTNLNEQQAIATTLFDMDKEIESLEIKKSKYLRIKQGMMQELLTGKTRLV